MSYIDGDEQIKSLSNDSKILDKLDCYNCTACSYPVEILSINDKENKIKFKCLNPNKKDNHGIQEIAINEYINSMKKNNYLFSQCYICKTLQNEAEDNSIFSYCIKCDKIICNNCINEHLKLNGNNHENMCKDYIIRNNEKGIKCLLHPTEKNIAFCFNCNTHLCNKCLKSKKHIRHRKNDLIEIKLSEEVSKKFNDIINIYEKKREILIQDRKNKELELNNKQKSDIKNVTEENERKIKELKNEYENGKIKNEEICNDDLNEAVNNLDCNKKIKENENLLLINNIVKKAKEIYEDNYYNNNNINNIMYNYYNSDDSYIKNLLNDKDEIHEELIKKEEEERKYKMENPDIEILKSENTESRNMIKKLTEEVEKLKSKSSEKYICKIKTDEEKGYGFLFYIPNPVLAIPGNILKKEDIGTGKEITLSFNNDKIIKVIKMNENRNINIVDRLDGKEVNIITIELNENEDGLEKQKFFNLDSLGRAIKEYFKNKNEIIITLNVDEKDINKDIYFLDNTNGVYIEDGEDIKHIHDNLQELNANNTKLYINNENKDFKKYFNPKEKGVYEIKLDFKIKLKNCSYMFCGCNNITKIDLSFFNAQDVTDMKHMFANCTSLLDMNFSTVNTGNVIDMDSMFSFCSGLKSLSLQFFNTKNVRNMTSMFYGCYSLTMLNLSSFNTQDVVNMKWMFENCSSITSLNLSSFNATNADTYLMFSGCNKLLSCESSDKNIIETFDKK